MKPLLTPQKEVTTIYLAGKPIKVENLTTQANSKLLTSFTTRGPHVE